MSNNLSHSTWWIPFSEHNGFSANQKIPHFLQNVYSHKAWP